jgi:hypothetical protein
MSTEKTTLQAPDYSLNYTDLLLSAAVHLIETGKGSFIVSRAGFYVKSPNDNSPSWCPSWISEDPGLESDMPIPLLSNHHGLFNNLLMATRPMYAAGTTPAQLPCS